MDSDNRTPSDVVRLVLKSEEQGDLLSVQDLFWRPPPIFEFEKRREERRRPFGPADTTGMQMAGARFGTILGEWETEYEGIYKVDFNLFYPTGRMQRECRFVRKIGGRWRIVQSSAIWEYVVPVNELGITPPS